MPSTVILGGGIIGLSTAYYASLASPTTKIHIIESSPTLFSSASGKAAGFLARDWFDSSVTELGELSFTLHQQLAHENNGGVKWGYSGSTGVSISEAGGGARGQDWLFEGTSRASVASSHVISDTNALPLWIKGSGDKMVEVISEPDTSGQVNPLQLCQFLLGECLARGVVLHYPAKATQVRVENGVVVGVQVEEEEKEVVEFVKCDRVLIACGVWTSTVFDELFPRATIKLPVSSLAGYSLILRSPRWISEDASSGRGCHAVFTIDPDGWSPEIFSRRDGEIYIAGLNFGTIPIPKSADETVFEEKDIEPMIKTAKRLLGEDIEVVKSGLCFRPVTASRKPIVAKVPSGNIGLEGTEGGVYVATGHGPWGIALSLGTGKVMAEMMNGDKTSANVEGLGI